MTLQLDETGVVLYKTRSPYASFVTAVTKQPFSNAGFFYRTTIYGQEDYVVVGMDLFGLQRPKIGDPNMTLEKLKSNPNIERLAIRPLKTIESDESISKNLEDTFRYLMATIEAEPASPEATVADVFGMKYPAQDKQKTPIQLINDIIFKLNREYSSYISNQTANETGRSLPNNCSGNERPVSSPDNYSDNERSVSLSEQLSDNERPSLSTWEDLKLPEHLSDNETGRLQLAALIGTPFFRGSETPGMGSIISERQIFGNLQYLPLEDHDPLVVKKHILDATSAEAAFMRKFSEAFVAMLFKDRNFLSAVIEGVNTGRELTSRGRIVEEEIVDKTIESGRELVETLNISLENGTISYQELKESLNKHLSNLSFLGNMRGVESRLPTLKPLTKNQTIVVEINEASDGVNSDLNSVMLSLEQCATDLRSHKNPHIDITQVCSLLAKLTGKSISFPSGNHGAILISSNSSTKIEMDQNITFVYPTTTTEELKKFSQDQLKEIDRHLYSSSNSSQFEGVRARIASLLQ